jgi:hypothetical protein
MCQMSHRGGAFPRVLCLRRKGKMNVNPFLHNRCKCLLWIEMELAFCFDRPLHLSVLGPIPVTAAKSILLSCVGSTRSSLTFPSTRSQQSRHRES